ncbi:NACHT, LRR and PYD domains-containing protein 14 isoform X2 [Fukomys damarensis]|uniref:NACHT, LRR and PYD domains-containing protein 14 isoform X2 n=1 Tax=Fukomys damarensis TaxID=885580 RepID=UPI00053F5407|nr:NACHT, LRR and PYD domains-containing protein 14 isoform X2 [Fukomys damarensis]
MPWGVSWRCKQGSEGALFLTSQWVLTHTGPAHTALLLSLRTQRGGEGTDFKSRRTASTCGALKIFPLPSCCGFWWWGLTRATNTQGTTKTMEKEVAVAEEALDEEVEMSAGTEYKIRIKEKFHILDQNSLLREPSDFLHGLSEEHQKLLEHLFDVEVESGQQIHTVVLQGPAGVGKTALMRKAMLDWAEGNLFQHKFTYVFYLGGKEISQMKEKSFAQLISKDWPSTEIPIERILSQPNKLLFIIDSFDELNFAFEEPEFALTGDWTQVQPVSFLLSSLLRKVMLPASSLLVTVRHTASKRLKGLLNRRLLKSQLYVDLQGMSKDARKEYIYQFFEDRISATNAFNSLSSNEVLFDMCCVPLVCQLICACLKQQMEKNDDITGTCQTTTAMFTCCISSLFLPADEYFANLPNETQLRSLCYLAAKGVWAMTHVLYRKDFRKYGFTTCDTSVFLDTNIIQKEAEYDNCYVFTHLHIQEFFGAMYYLLKSDLEHKEHSSKTFEDLNLLLESRSDQDPHLTQLKYFLFGLLNEDLVKQLEETFKCKMSLKIKWEVLQWVKVLGSRDTFPPWLVFMDLFHYLYESQDEAFIAKAMGNFSKIIVNMSREIDLLVSSFCLKHCRCLQTLKLALMMVNSSSAAEYRKMGGFSITHCWQNLFSVLNTNEHLTELDLSHSNFDELMMKNFCQELRHPNCKLQKLLLRFVCFPPGYQGIFSFLIHQQNLMYLDLKGSKIEANEIRSLCEALKYPECKLQNLRLESCDITAICCAYISKALIKNQSLVFLSLSTNSLLDEGVKWLCEALGHSECNLERLSLESCGFTEASCKNLSSALISNKRLTHLCLSNNKVGDRGAKLLSAALKHPECTLQSLVLRCCCFTSISSEYLSTFLYNKSLKHLDLGSNCLQDDGANLLCNVFLQPSCNLQDLELMGCVLTTACCPDLASAILNSPSLLSLDLGYNDLLDEGMKILCEALRNPNCNIQRLGLEHCGLTSLCCQDLSSALLSNQKLVKMNLTQNTLGYEGLRTLCEVLRSAECKLQVLGLWKDTFDKEAQKLLEAVRVSNPKLVIDSSYNKKEWWSWWWYF